MDLSTFLWTSFAAFATLATFSFLYKDNPFYKIAEHLVVGVSAGYFVVILWHNGLVPNLFQRLADGHVYYLFLDSSKWFYVIPSVLGILMWTRFSKKYGWISRWPMALYIGIATGTAIPLEMSARVNKQLFATMTPITWSNFLGHGFLDVMAGYSQLLIFAGALCALVYFFFSKAHTGVFGGIAAFGIWILMIGFGASFGFTVMARISLLIQRIQFLENNWITAAFDSSNQNYNSGFQIAFWVLVALIVIYILRELILFARHPKQAS